MEVETARYEDTKEIVSSLLRYDMTPHHMAYYIRGYNPIACTIAVLYYLFQATQLAMNVVG